MPETPGPDATLRAALHGVRGLLLDLDGVLVLAGERRFQGAPEALAELDRRGFPYLVVTNTSLVSRTALARWGAEGRVHDAAGPVPVGAVGVGRRWSGASSASGRCT